MGGVHSRLAGRRPCNASVTDGVVDDDRAALVNQHGEISISGNALVHLERRRDRERLLLLRNRQHLTRHGVARAFGNDPNGAMAVAVTSGGEPSPAPTQGLCRRGDAAVWSQPLCAHHLQQEAQAGITSQDFDPR
jgi:hypothetical protein